jgi:hypothetical protein
MQIDRKLVEFQVSASSPATGVSEVSKIIAWTEDKSNAIESVPPPLTY